MMFPSLRISKHLQLTLIYTLVLLWTVLSVWPIIWPLTLFSVPVILCFSYVLFRLVLELTVRRNQHSPTLATCFASRQKTASILKEEAERSEKDSYNIVDLGSGRGELARCIAKKIPKANVLGIENAKFPFGQSFFMQKFLGPKNLSFNQCDFWSFDCSSVDAITLYLGPLTVQEVGEKLYRELKRGSLVLSQSYPLKGAWMPVDVVTLYSPFRETIYVYKR